MLKWETRTSETLLKVEKLARPFCYKLHIHADLPAEALAQAGGQTREKIVDVPETFNYLLGLHIQTRRVYDDNVREHLRAMNTRRPEPITLRYFQHVAVLYTEIFLDMGQKEVCQCAYSLPGAQRGVRLYEKSIQGPAKGIHLTAVSLRFTAAGDVQR